MCKTFIKNSQPSGKNALKPQGRIFFDSHCIASAYFIAMHSTDSQRVCVQFSQISSKCFSRSDSSASFYIHCSVLGNKSK